VKLKAETKRLKNQVFYAKQSRDELRQRAKELEAENAALKEAALKKSGPGGGLSDR
jgi:FtsZ-binding cell division protein ZapB